MSSPKILKVGHAHRLSAFLPVVLAVIGIVLVLLRNHPYGPGLHFDAVNYIGVARNLLAGEGWIEFHGNPYVVNPPAYPTLLALFGWLSGFGPRAIAGPLNALLFGLTVFVAARWLLEIITFRWLALWGGLAAALSLPLTAMASHAMTEPAFILFVTLALFCMDRYLRGRRDALIWAALFTSLAWLTRYVGVAAVITLLPFPLFQSGVRLLEKLKRTAVFGLIAGLPIGLWAIDRIGHRLQAWPPSFTLSEFLESSLSELGKWILPALSQETAMALAAVMLFALAIAIGLALVRRPSGWRAFCLCGGFTLIYFILMGIITIMITEYDVVFWHSRYWTPMYIPLLIALVFAMDRLLVWLRNAVRPPALKTFASGAIALLLFIWLGNAVELNRVAIISASQGKDKYHAGPHVVNNEVLQFIREASASDKIFINEAYYSRLAILYIASGRPLADFHFLPQDLEQLPQTVAAAAAGDLLIWLHDPVIPYSYGLPELESMSSLERTADLRGGVVFRINQF